MKRVTRAQPHIPEADIETTLELIRQSLVTGHLTNGSHVREFETRFAEMAGVRHAVAVSTGTAALEIALRAIDVRGKEVIVPSETFVASVNSIILGGGTPVFAEIHPDTYCLDLQDVKRKITEKTAAVMLVHMAGLIVPNIGAFQALCEAHGMDLIEDAAHAHGASLGGKRAGSFGRAGCFSFYPTKVITSAEGGMITTDDDELAKTARSLRNHGANPDGSPDYTLVSNNMRMAEPLAAIGLVQLRRLQEFLDHRNMIAAIYTRGLQGANGIRTLPVAEGVHSYWNYLAVVDASVNRSELAQRLREQFGVDIAWPYDPPCHLQPVFRKVLGTKHGDLPVSEGALQRHIALPMHCGLTSMDAEYVVDSLRQAVSEVRSLRANA